MFLLGRGREGDVREGVSLFYFLKKAVSSCNIGSPPWFSFSLSSQGFKVVNPCEINHVFNHLLVMKNSLLFGVNDHGVFFS